MRGRGEEGGVFLLSLSVEGSSRFGCSMECVSTDAHRATPCGESDGIYKRRHLEATASHCSSGTRGDTPVEYGETSAGRNMAYLLGERRSGKSFSCISAALLLLFRSWCIGGECKRLPGAFGGHCVST